MGKIVSRFSFFAIVLTFICSNAFAETNIIRQIFLDRDRAIAEVDEASKGIKEFVVTFPGQSQCVFKVVDAKESLVSLDVQNCAYKTLLRPGMKVEASLLFGVDSSVPVVTKIAPPSSEGISPQAPTTVDPKTSGPSSSKTPEVANDSSDKVVTADDHQLDDQIHFGIGLGLSLIPKLNFKNGSASSATFLFDSDWSLEGGYSVSADLRKMPSNRWGFLGQINHEGARKVSSISFSSSGQTATVTGNSGAATLATTTIEANAVYRWNTFYIPFGLNYSKFNFQAASGFVGSYTVVDGIGAQFGLGLMIGSRCAIELWSRAANIKIKTLSAGVSVDYGDGTYSSTGLTLKALF